MSLRTPEEYHIIFVVVGDYYQQPAFLSSVPLHVSLLSGIFVPLNELRDGPNQNQSYLTMTLLYVYLLDFFNVWRKNDDHRLLGGLFIIPFYDYQIIFFQMEDHISCCVGKDISIHDF